VPLYPYHCRACGETTEIFARTPSEDLGPKLRCAHCDSTDVERRMALPVLPADEKQLRGMLRRRAESEGIGRSHLDG
jgi:putative FmdB family regulatory protein